MENLTKIKDKYRRIAYHRASVVRAFLEYDPSHSVTACQKFTKNVLPMRKELVEALGKVPAGNTLYRWVRAYLDSGKNPGSLAPRYKDGEGAGSKTLSKAEKNVLMVFWAKEAAWSVRKCVDEAQKALGHQLSYPTCLRFLNSQPRAYWIAMREGSKKFNDKINPYIDRDYTLLKSMKMVTSDHHMLDFFVQRNGRVFRPWVTAFTDIRSRKVLSWVMCETPNSLTILHALQIFTWRYGLAEELVFDNGKDYRSELFRGGVKEVKGKTYSLIDESKKVEIMGVLDGLGCKVTYCEPYHGQSKPIERFFGTLAGRFSKSMPTYCGSNTATRPDEAKLYHKTIGQMKKKNVVLSYDEAAARLNRYMDEYNATWNHSGKGMNGKTPDQIFKANLQGKRVLHNAARQLVFTEASIREVNRYGVRVDNRIYYNTMMIELIGKKALVRRPLFSDDFVFICDLDGRELMTASFNPLRDSGDVKDNNERKNSAKKEIRQKIRVFEDQIRKAQGIPEIEQYEQAEAAKNLEYLEEYKKAVGAENEQSPSLLGSTARPYRKPKAKLSLLG